MARGVSLVECLFSLAIMAAFLVPISVSLMQGNAYHRNQKYAHSRDLIISSRQDQLATPLNTFTSLFDSSNLNVSQSNRSISSLVEVDTANSTVFNRKWYLYIYNPGKSGASWSDAITMNTQVGVFYLDVGNTTAAATDALGNAWSTDAAYGNTDKVAGTVTGYSGSVPTASTNDITNTTSDAIYQTARQGADLRYNIPVENGMYYVEFHATEWNAAITAASPNRRRMDLYLELISDTDTPVGTSLSPRETMGAANLAVAYRYPVTVSDGLLNIRVKRSSTSNFDPQLMGLAIYPRGVL
jgi:hypothetical protein